MKQYVAIIIGSGQAGNPLASRLAATGWKVALVEKGRLGGTCINEGCTPTKTIRASAAAAFLIARDKEYGIKSSKPTVDIAAVLERKNNVINRFRTSMKNSLTARENLDIIYGEAVFTGYKQIAVTDEDYNIEHYSARYIFI